MEMNLVEVESEKLTAERRRFVSSRFEREKSALLELHGESAYMAIGALLAGHFENHLLSLAGRWARGTLPVSLPPGLTEDADLQALRALSGRFLEKAVHSGLLSPGLAGDRDLGLVARSLFLQNWVLGLGIKAPDRRLAVEENALVLKWKVEASEHLSLERRLELTARIPMLERNYPSTYVRGVLLASRSHHEQAVAAFIECVETGEMEDRAREWLLALRTL